MYHISDLKKFERCERLYFYDRDSQDEFIPYLRIDEPLITLLVQYLKITKYYEGIRNDTNDHFFSERDNYEWFTRTRFQLDELRIYIPLMHKVKDGYELYFIYNGTFIKEPDYFTYNIVVSVMETLGLKVKRFYLAYINPSYVFHDELDVKRLFIIKSKFNGELILNQIRKKEVDYEAIIYQINHAELSDYYPKGYKNCGGKNPCKHLYKCYPNILDIPDNSILTLVSSAKKNDMYKRGIRYLKDCDLEMLEGNRVQYAQVMADRNGGLFVDKIALNKWLLSFNETPISFIDFEWDKYLVPLYEGLKPMDVVCFEFALYYLDEKGELQHRTFISNHDCRKDFIEALLMYLPKKGPILAYNAIGAECLRIKELIEQFPEYEKELTQINNRFVDLSIPFTEGLIYDTRMRGEFSLKKLVSIVSDYSYQDLNIEDGMSAVYSWRTTDIGEEDKKKVFADLEKYCSLDAYGLLLVYRWLIELVCE